MLIAVLIATGNTGSHQDSSTAPSAQSTVVIPIPRKASRDSVSLESVPSVNGYTIVPHRGTYGTGRLAGTTATSLYAMYIGHEGVLPKRLQVNWNRQLEKLWARKSRISQRTVVRETGTMLVLEYMTRDPGRMTLRQYQKIAAAQARQTHVRLRWATVGTLYFRSPAGAVDTRRLALLKRLAGRIRGRTLTAYMMTELLPGSGAQGYAYLDFMLRHGGRRYVESIPAQYDRLTSFGPFQFTAHAVYDVGNVGKLGGASRMNRALPRALRIPGSVSKLRGDQHLRAGYLFAVSNLAVFIKRLDARQVATLERIADTRELDLAQFIATAHNKPEVAYAAGRRWLTAKQPADYRDACPKISRLYADKTIKNFRSLEEFL